MFSLLSIYVIVNLLFSINVAKRFLQIPIISLSYWILHLAYGFGFIWGCVRFCNKWLDNKQQDIHFNKQQFDNNNTNK